MGRVKQSRRPRVKTPTLRSDLAKPMWAMASETGKVTHLGCSYDEAFELAKQYRDRGCDAVVMTDAAASRIHGFNELLG